MSVDHNNLHDNPDDDLVTIAKFLEPVQAQLAKGMLDSAGIDSFLLGENANSMLAFAFRVRLQVRRGEEAAARRLLAQGGSEADEVIGE
jgi:hypothetical protein